jgi:uncharacterized protein YgbK (DUF1537 family)
VGLVADDLTGATDSAVEFASVGWDVTLVRHLVDLPQLAARADQPGLTAVATACRSSTEGEAARRTATAVDALAGTGVRSLFLKIDSTVRGSVAGQVAGALAAWRRVHPDAVAVICPAFPDQGRTVVAGVVLVDGVPVARSAAAADPKTPVTDSALDQLVPGSLPVPPGSDLPSGSGTERFTVDARTNADLDVVASMIDRLGPRVVAVGSAGLARAMAARWASAATIRPQRQGPALRRVLVAVSSVHPATQEQVARLLETFPDATQAHPMAGPSPSDAGVRLLCTQEAPAARAHSISAALAERVVDELQDRHYDALVSVGGDGALAILDRLRAKGIRITGRISAGVPQGVLIGGLADGLPVVTKSGGFGDGRTLVDIIRRIRNEPTRPIPPEQKDRA